MEIQRGWFTTATVAEIFDVTPEGFRKSYRQYVPESAVREHGRGKPTLIHARSVINEYAQRKFGGEDAILAGGGDSPALEQVRQHEARIRKVKADEAERTHMSLELLEQGMNLLGQVLRRGGEQMRRLYGNPAGDFLEEMVNEYVQELNRYFANLKSGTSVEPMKEAAPEDAASNLASP